MRTLPLVTSLRARDVGLGATAAEAEAVHASAGVADISDWGHFTLAGKESVRFLQGLVTNDVAALAPGTGCYAAFLNVHGRIEADAHVFSFGDELVIQTPPEAAEWVERSLGRFRLAGDFRLARLGATDAAVTVQGPAASRAVGALLGAPLDEVGPLGCREVARGGATLRLLGVRRSTEWGVDLLGPAAAVRSLCDRLLDGDSGVTAFGPEALELLRMEAGIPRFGRDFDSDTVLQEVDVPEIVSFTKGCYLGQEVVARLHYLGQPSKLLRRLEVEGDVLPAPGDEVVSSGEDGRSAGRVTSVALSPSRGPIVFAVVKRKHYALGTAVLVRHGEAFLEATVAERGTDPIAGGGG